MFAACPHDFYYVPEVNECLFVNVKPVNWSVAQQSCATFKKGAQLLTIQDTVKQEAVTRYIKSVMASKQFEFTSNLSGCIRCSLVYGHSKYSLSHFAACTVAGIRKLICAY